MTLSLSNSEISNALVRYGVSADDPLCDGIRAYISLLLRWNERISLTTVTEPAEILRFHFGESFFATSAVPIQFGRLADVGSGAGFPGIPLAMLAPELQVSLIESNFKKSTFLSEVVRSLNLERVAVFRLRMEAVRTGPDKFDFVTARAVGSFEDLLSWSSRSLAEAGKLVLWVGGEDAARISAMSRWSWRDPIRIPDSKNRFLLVGSPKRPK
jgi:16S rRNA (guanine527-N7)-methyltransferase